MKHLLIALLTLILIGCTSEPKVKKAKNSKKKVEAPIFNQDSAYNFIASQVAFGPRVPNTKGHIACGDYLIETLKSYCDTVIVQEAQLTAFDGNVLNSKNIIASFKPKRAKRIMLCAHWDTRPFADQDTEDTNKAIDGANDGASGVAVLLEIARSISSQPLSSEVGIDLIFFDGEDDGEPEYASSRDNSKIWWCHGSQYWSKNKHLPNYSAYYGILVDLVGGKNARFYREGYSRRFASGILSKVWGNASLLGHGSYFIQQDSPEILDDHVFVNEWAGVPMIDIIDFSPDLGFGAYHHTHRDAMDGIDARTLRVVGETVLATIYQE